MWRQAGHPARLGGVERHGGSESHDVDAAVGSYGGLCEGIESTFGEANLGSEGILEFVAMATKDDLDVPRLGQTRRCLRRTRSSFDWQTSMWRCLRARTCLEKHAAEQAKGDILLVSFLADFCRA